MQQASDGQDSRAPARAEFEGTRAGPAKARASQYAPVEDTTEPVKPDAVFPNKLGEFPRGWNGLFL